MMSGSILSLALLVAISALAPHFVSRGALRSRLVTADAVSTALLLGFWYLASLLEVPVSDGAACGLLLGAKLIVHTVVVWSTNDESDVVWSPGRAGVLAALVYLALVPNALVHHTDGDESFYVLNAESIQHDFDLDLRNQYAELERSVVGRLDLEPQLGDPVGPEGQVYSRHEPLLSFVLIPGILVGGLAGAVATIALLAALAMRAITALLEDEGATTRLQLLVFAFVGLAPPFLNFATRIWPEAPGAFLLAEMLRAARAKRIGRLVLFGVALSALKLRFAPIALTLLLVVLLAGKVRRRWVIAGLTGVTAVLAIAWFVMPGIFVVRFFDPREVFVPDNFARGILGILLDGQAGLLFQAPLFLVGLAAILRWRSLGTTVRLGCVSALPYLCLLIPRSEWHGGWSPPLRYLAVFAPLFALLAAKAIEEIVRRWAVIMSVTWTSALAAYAVAYPPRQFRIAAGESAFGEYLSRIWGTDFSRMVPSLIRPNEAALWASVVLLIFGAWIFLRRGSGERARTPALAALLSVAIVCGAWTGLRPGRVVEFEDAHVVKRGGELYPERWTVARFRFRGGWTLHAGDAVAFAHPGGAVSLSYYCDQPTVIDVDGVTFDVPTATEYQDLVFLLSKSTNDRHEIRCVSGALILDRLATE